MRFWGIHLREIAQWRYDDVIMGAIASQITSLTSVNSTVYSDADYRKHQSSASLAFVWGIHRGPVNSPHKWPLTRKMFPFDDVIMSVLAIILNNESRNYSFEITATSSWGQSVYLFQYYIWIHHLFTLPSLESSKYFFLLIFLLRTFQHGWRHRRHR